MNWLEKNAPWYESYALWRDHNEVALPYRVKAFIADRQLGVVKDRIAVRIQIVDHDWSAAYAEARERLGDV